MVFPSEALQVVIFVLLLSLASEISLYLWCYSAPSFRTINANVTKQCRKLESIRLASLSAQPKSKKAERLEKGMKQDATKELAVLKVKQTVVASTLDTAQALSHSFCLTMPLVLQSVVGAVGMFLLLNRL